mmetsp:Transcript_23550/g.40688  ORF Transcript_23550/g.40688 Transcript_23550/m.40688 type:complete len:448 (-) Transcript_23550:1054-2397(-)
MVAHDAGLPPLRDGEGRAEVLQEAVVLDQGVALPGDLDPQELVVLEDVLQQRPRAPGGDHDPLAVPVHDVVARDRRVRPERQPHAALAAGLDGVVPHCQVRLVRHDAVVLAEADLVLDDLRGAALVDPQALGGVVVQVALLHAHPGLVGDVHPRLRRPAAAGLEHARLCPRVRQPHAHSAGGDLVVLDLRPRPALDDHAGPLAVVDLVADDHRDGVGVGGQSKGPVVVDLVLTDVSGALEGHAQPSALVLGDLIVFHHRIGLRLHEDSKAGMGTNLVGLHFWVGLCRDVQPVTFAIMNLVAGHFRVAEFAFNPPRIAGVAFDIVVLIVSAGVGDDQALRLAVGDVVVEDAGLGLVGHLDVGLGVAADVVALQDRLGLVADEHALRMAVLDLVVDDGGLRQRPHSHAVASVLEDLVALKDPFPMIKHVHSCIKAVADGVVLDFRMGVG